MVYAILRLRLVDMFIKLPTVDELQQIATGFKLETGYLNCIGAIDGVHVRVKVLVNEKASYYNYKQDFSISTMAICDQI